MKEAGFSKAIGKVNVAGSGTIIDGITTTNEIMTGDKRHRS
jgi:hypothetical protein